MRLCARRACSVNVFDWEANAYGTIGRPLVLPDCEGLLQLSILERLSHETARHRSYLNGSCYFDRHTP